MLNHLGICFLVASLAACSGNAAPDTSKRAATAPARASSDTEAVQYIRALVQAIESADQIIVTEHSFDYDAYDMENQKSLLEKPVVYATKELTAEQAATFKSTVSALDPKTQDAFAACIFEPHHTVRFMRSGKEQSKMLICFECAQVEWDGSSATPPWSLYSGLRQFVSGIGLHPERDWHALAKEHVK